MLPSTATVVPLGSPTPIPSAWASVSGRQVQPLTLVASQPRALPRLSEAVPAVERSPAVGVGRAAPRVRRVTAIEQAARPRRLWWGRNVVLGAGLSFADAGVMALSPVAFVWRHLNVIAQAAFYLALPLLVSFWLLDRLPGLAQAYHPGTPWGSVYLLGLYISASFLLMLGAFTTGFVFRGALRLMDHFARRGEEAFPPR